MKVPLWIDAPMKRVAASYVLFDDETEFAPLWARATARGRT